MFAKHVALIIIAAEIRLTTVNSSTPYDHPCPEVWSLHFIQGRQQHERRTGFKIFLLGFESSQGKKMRFWPEGQFLAISWSRWNRQIKCLSYPATIHIGTAYKISGIQLKLVSGYATLLPSRNISATTFEATESLPMATSFRQLPLGIGKAL